LGSVSPRQSRNKTNYFYGHPIGYFIICVEWEASDLLKIIDFKIREGTPGATTLFPTDCGR